MRRGRRRCRPWGSSRDDFAVHRAEVRPGVETAYLREGVGGYPLLLVHGWPETKRIWWRNVAPLAEAGFEVIVPDLRGFGDSGLAPDEPLRPRRQRARPARARARRARPRALRGRGRRLRRGDRPGPGTALRGLRRAPGAVQHDAPAPARPSTRPPGWRSRPPRETRMAADYFVRQGRDADALAAELDTPDKRRRYVGEILRPPLLGGARVLRGRGRRLHDRAVRRRRPPARLLRPVRVGARHAPAVRAAALLRAQPGADAGPVRARGPRASGATSRSAARSPSPSWSARSSCRARGTSSSGSGPSCSTARSPISCATCSPDRRPTPAMTALEWRSRTTAGL